MDVTIHGVNPTGTIELLKERAYRWGRGGMPADGRKVALIVEGGAMRGVISCAALMGLEELGMTHVFDEVYGASAGAVNAAYFLAEQAAYATTIYYQKINNTRFLRRLWHRKVVDIDDLFETVIARERPLRVDKVLAARSRLFITIADASTGEAFLSEAQSSGTPLLTLLKASSAMPILYNGLIPVDGRECFDGALINPLPVLEAMASGCTDLLVLLTRPASFRENLPGRLEQRIFEMWCAKGNSQLMAAYCNMHVRHNSVRDIVLGREPVPEGINIATLCPEEKDPRVERMTRSTEVLRAAAIGSAKRTLRAFGRRVDDFVEVLRPYTSCPQDPERAIPESDDSALFHRLESFGLAVENFENRE
jgi:predicted patatin/cPLA2 family phospholipase